VSRLTCHPNEKSFSKLFKQAILSLTAQYEGTLGVEFCDVTVGRVTKKCKYSILSSYNTTNLCLKISRKSIALFMSSVSRRQMQIKGEN
jgi:hypothetical protein